MGHIVPLMETELANVIPMWMDAPAPAPPAYMAREFTEAKSEPAVSIFSQTDSNTLYTTNYILSIIM